MTTAITTAIRTAIAATIAAVMAWALTACGFDQPPKPGDPGGGGDDGAPGGGADAATEPGCAAVGDPFAAATLQAGVDRLASDELGGRLSGTPGDLATRAYIEDAYRCAGLTAALADGAYQQPFVAPDGTAAANLVAYLPGSDPALASEVIVVGAHHDHLGTKAGQVYNGANDNASGTIALLALARSLAAAPPKRTVAFVAFGYEEHVGRCEGSEYFVRHAPPALAMDRVKYMVDLDMVGTYSIAGELTVYGSVAGSQGRKVLDALAPSYAGLKLTHSGNAEADDSDFQAFADRQVPYVYFETWDEACYHKPCDDAARIDAANMSRIAQLARDLVLALAGG